MHIERQIQLAVRTALTGVEGVVNVRLTDAPLGINEHDLPLLCVYGAEDLEPVLINQSTSGKRPTYRGFRFIVGVVTLVEDWEDGKMHEIRVEIERRLMADGTELREIARRGIKYLGGAIGPVENFDEARVYAMVFDFHVPMVEGVADRLG